MKERSIKRINSSILIDMWWVMVNQSLPSKTTDYIDPFLLIHHLKDSYPWWQTSKWLWVWPHPHRWFSPVSFIYKWENEHRDSRWNRAIIWEGWTQWMHVWMWVVHSERPSEFMAQKWWDYELIQFWVNSPSKNKMDQPYYYPLSHEETPVYKSEWVYIYICCCLRI